MTKLEQYLACVLELENNPTPELMNKHGKLKKEIEMMELDSANLRRVDSLLTECNIDNLEVFIVEFHELLKNQRTQTDIENQKKIDGVNQIYQDFKDIPMCKIGEIVLEQLQKLLERKN